jgi:hypothetical protein
MCQVCPGHVHVLLSMVIMRYLSPDTEALATHRESDLVIASRFFHMVN